MEKNNHTILKKYFEDHSLVDSNITSFNNFIKFRMQEIVDEVSESIEPDDFQISLGKIEVGRPDIIEADGSSSFITPSDARLRDLTYSAPVKLEITVRRGEQADSEVVEIGRMPIMVKSDVCNTKGMNRDELIQSFNDPLDSGGYFIVKGNERVMIMAEDLAENQAFLENNKDGNLFLGLFSLKGTYRIPTYIIESKKGVFELDFSRFKGIPLIVILKALGLTKDSDIAKYIGKETDSLIVNLYEYANITTRDEAIEFIAEKTNLQGTRKEILDRVNQR
ncbi:MAG: hypothetical protein ACOC1P_01180, partial [Minisyncoccales bacterium]